MRRDFLKDLGIEDKEIIDKILDENSSDIGKAKGDLESYKNKVSELEKQITSKDSEIASLNKKVGDVDKLTEQVNTLTKDNEKLNSDLTNKLNEVQKNHAIENGVRDAKAKNVKAVMALLDQSKITYKDGVLEGLSEQLESLTKDDSSSFMFDNSAPIPKGFKPNDPPRGGGSPSGSPTLADAVAKALSKN